MKLSDPIKLELFIKKFIPNGWKEPIGSAMFVPIILNNEYESILKGDIPESYHPIIKLAIETYLKGVK